MEIDLVVLCLSAGAELILADVNGLDTATSTLHFANAESLHFDVLSIGVGSMPAGWRDMQSKSLVPIKPMNTFLDRLDGRFRELIQSRAPHESCPLRISVVWWWRCKY